jgi:VanZ family protein
LDVLEGLRGRIRWRFYMHGLPATVWAGVLLALALAPNLGPIEDIQVISHQDKLLHFGEYLVLAVLTAFALASGTYRNERYQLIVAVVGPTVYGVILEVVQLWVPARSFSGLDMLANGLGAALGGFWGVGFFRRIALRKD